MALVRLTAKFREKPRALFSGSDIRDIEIQTPEQALTSLTQVLHAGIVKHGSFDPSKFTVEHFMDKYRRHMTRAFHTPLDESGQPHIIHAAADLLFAWECNVTNR